MTILPTHSCFDDAAMWVALHLSGQRPPMTTSKTKDLRVVHAICLMPNPPDVGKRFAHAWIEDRHQVWQAGLREDTGERVWVALPREPFEVRLAIQWRRRYTLREYCALAVERQTHGPFHPELAALCREINGREKSAAPAGEQDRHDPQS